ncbi:hypothetical protein SVIOM74S_03272 [Streptomyces violarus]
MGGVGATVGLLLGGVLTDALDWRWVFFVNIPIAPGATAQDRDSRRHTDGDARWCSGCWQPAGAGTSTGVSRAAARLPRPVAWLSADAPTPVRVACSPTSKRSWHGTQPPRSRWRHVRCARASSTRNPAGRLAESLRDGTLVLVLGDLVRLGVSAKWQRSAPSCTDRRDRCARSWSAGAISRRR